MDTCHRDIKPDNLLFDRKNCHIWLIDFGISKFEVHAKGMLTVTGSTNYKAPEMFSGGCYDELIDEWAVGVTLYEMVERHIPFEHEYLAERIESICRIDYKTSPMWDRYDNSAK